MSRSIILLGGPDSGKTNYIGRLWRALDDGTGALHAAEQPEDISFVLEVADHLFEGGFAPRSEHSDARRDFDERTPHYSSCGLIPIRMSDHSIGSHRAKCWKSSVE
ncbi:hypothetical protein D3C85_1172750 [compost metagenome]